MPRLPDISDLGALPSGRSQRMIASYDTTPIGLGMQRFGGGLSDLGSALTKRAAAEAAFQAEIEAQHAKASIARPGAGTAPAAGGAPPAPGSAVPPLPNLRSDIVRQQADMVRGALDGGSSAGDDHLAHALFGNVVEQAILPRAAAAGALPAWDYRKADARNEVIADGHNVVDAHPALSPAQKAATRDALLTAIDTTFARHLSDEEQIALDPNAPPRETVIDRLVRLMMPGVADQNGTQARLRPTSATIRPFSDASTEARSGGDSESGVKQAQLIEIAPWLDLFGRAGPDLLFGRFPVPPLPGGMTRAGLGRLLRWGSDIDGARPWFEQLKSDPEMAKQITRDLQEKGMTKELMRQWAEFYGKNAEHNPAAEQFRYRQEGLKRLFDQFPDDGSVPSVGA